MRVIARFAAGTVAISFSAALRGTSTRIESSAARTWRRAAAGDQADLAEDRAGADRHDDRRVGGLTSTSTEPDAIANSEEPGSLRSNTTAPAR
jgi:hypothetical protein